MSGVVAVYERDGRPASEALVAAMLGAITHCATDGSGAWVRGSAGLGHALLATTPEDTLVAQPCASPDGRLAIAGDLRVDNRDELFEAGLCRGRRAAEVADIELVLAAYERWGDECAGRIVGDFAFVVIDGPRRRLFAARDPMGVRPLYYRATRTGLRAASEIEALFADLEARRAPNLHAAALSLIWWHTETRETLYRDVLPLPPGHRLVCTEGSLTVERWWSPDPERAIRHRTDAEHAEHFRAVLDEAVRCRLRSSTPVACEASGGHDSSSVVGVAEQLRRRGRAPGPPLTLVACRFPNLACDEGPFSDAVAAQWGLPLLDFDVLGPSPELHRFEAWREAPDVPYNPALLNCLTEYALLRDRGIRVLLGGVGSDQLFGRTNFEIEELARRGKLVAAAHVAGVLHNPLERSLWGRLGRGLVGALVPRRLRARIRAHRASRPVKAAAPDFVGPALAPILTEALVEDSRARGSRPGSSPTRGALLARYTEGNDMSIGVVARTYLGARRNIEPRHPFYDVRVVEHVLALPDEQRVGVRENKAVLLRALGKDLPDVVRQRPGGVDGTCYYERALVVNHGQALTKLLDSSLLEREGWLDGEATRRMLKRPAEFVSDLLAIVGLELWLQRTLALNQARGS